MHTSNEKQKEPNRPDIVVHDKKRREAIIIEVGIASQDRLHTVETEERRKYDELVNKLVMQKKWNQPEIIMQSRIVATITNNGMPAWPRSQKPASRQ